MIARTLAVSLSLIFGTFWIPTSVGADVNTLLPAPISASQIEIVLSTSRGQVSAGAGFGLTADVKNVSNEPVYLVCYYFDMTPPIEIDPQGPRMWSATIQGNQPAESDLFWPIRLGPGDKTTAFWASQPEVESAERTWQERTLTTLSYYLHLINFAPGDYTIKVIALYWPDEESAEAVSDNYRTETSQIKLPVVAPQWVIILGAAIGGLIAYLLFPKIRRRQNEVELLGLLSAILFSIIIRILLGRIADTQFFVKITVTDFWGAIAIGFIAVSSGNSLLQKYVESWGAPTGSKSSSSTVGTVISNVPATTPASATGGLETRRLPRMSRSRGQ